MLFDLTTNKHLIFLLAVLTREVEIVVVQEVIVRVAGEFVVTSNYSFFFQ